MMVKSSKPGKRHSGLIHQANGKPPAPKVTASNTASAKPAKTARHHGKNLGHFLHPKKGA